MRPGGLLVLELPHPSDLWGGYCLEDEQFVEAWDAQVGLSCRARSGWFQIGYLVVTVAASGLPICLCSSLTCTPSCACLHSLPTAARQCWWNGGGRVTTLTCKSRCSQDTGAGCGWRLLPLWRHDCWMPAAIRAVHTQKSTLLHLLLPYSTPVPAPPPMCRSCTALWG